MHRSGSEASEQYTGGGGQPPILFDDATFDLFERLCDLPPEQAAKELARVSDPDVAARVDHLLQQDRGAVEWFGTNAGSELVTSAVDVEDPSTLGRYRIVRRIGVGGMGIVYAAEEDHPRRTVALKVLHPAQRSDAILELFRFEAQALAQVQHPNVPSVYEAGVTDFGVLYLSMELVDGVALDAWVASEEPPLLERLAVLEQVCGAVHAVHATGVLHRDIKPSNVLMGPLGPKVLDFGIAAPVERAVAAAHPGTRAYMSPEARDGAALDERSDVYALGVLLRRVVGEASLPGLDAVIERATRSDRSLRPASAAALADDLRHVRTGATLPWNTQRSYRLAVTWNRWRTPVRRAAVVVGALLAVACVAAGLAEWNEQQRRNRADVHLRSLLASLEQAAASERWADGHTRIRRFLVDPEHLGTPAASEAWLQWARLLGARGENETPALAEAYLTAPNEALAQRALVRLGHAFARGGRFQELARLEALAEAPAELESAMQAGAVARRDFRGDTPLMRQLRQATDLGQIAYRAGWIDVDGDDRGDLVTFSRTHLQIGDQRHRLPDETAWTGIENLVRWRDAVWLGSGNGRNPAGLYKVGRTLEQVADLPQSGVQQVAVGSEGLWLARSYPNRGLSLYDGEMRVPHAPTDALRSDVMDVETVDIDGDGTDEVVVGLGAWDAYEVRVLQRGPDGWAIRSRAPLGDHTDFAIVGNTLVAGKIDLHPNPDVFGTHHPYGGPPGLVLFDLDPLVERRRIPLPVADDARTTRTRTVEDPVTGDFDGDGKPDIAWTLREMHADTEHLLWILLDVTGAAEGHVVAGLQAFSAEDRDGDGDDELLVADEDGALWVLGRGEDRLPLWEPKRSRVTLRAPETHDPLVRRSVQRASVLADLGLLEDAAIALLQLESQTQDPDVLRAAAWEAGRLLEREGLLDQAREAYARHGGAPVDEEMRTFQRQALDLEGARHDDPRLQRVAWGEHSEDWHLVEPAVDTQQGLVQLDAFNDQTVLARIPVTVEDLPWLEVAVSADVELLELGSGLSVELQRDGTPLLMVGFWGQGGGGAMNVQLQCGAGQAEWLAAPAVDPLGSYRVDLRAALHPGQLRCRGQMPGATDPFWKGYESTWPEPGPAELVLRTLGHPYYNPPTRLRVSSLDVSTVGLARRSVPHGPRARSLAALQQGRIEEVEDPSLKAWGALLEGDTGGLQEGLEHMPAAAQRHLLRIDGARVAPLLHDLLGPRFAAIQAQVLKEPVNRRQMRAEVQADLFRLSLTQMPLDDPAGRQLRSARARAHLQRGERGAAALHARAVAQTGARDAATVDALLLLAQLEPKAGWEERAIEASETPEITRARASRLAELP